MSITKSASNSIRNIGIALLLAGGALAYLALQRFDSLPNWQRIGCVVPLMASYPMLRVDRYRDWATIDIRERGRAIMAIAGPIFLAIGSLVWYIASPETRG